MLFPCFDKAIVLVIIITITTASVVAAESVLDRSKYGNLSPSVLAPGGRLYSVERTMQAIQEDHVLNNLVIALQCRDGIVVVTSQVVSPHLLLVNSSSSTTSTTEEITATAVAASSSSSSSSFPSLQLPDTGIPQPPFFRLSTRIWGVTAGRSTDAQLLRLQVHGVAERLRYTSQENYHDGNDDDSDAFDVSVLARRVADVRQRATQSVLSDDNENDDENDSVGLLNATALVFQRGNDLSFIWRMDPTGQFYSCQAAIVGRKADVAEADFIRRLVLQFSTSNNTNSNNEDDDRGNNDNDSNNTNTNVDPERLRQYVSQLSMDQAVAMASACIRQTLTTSTKRSSGGGGASSTMAFPPIITKALSLHRDTGEIKWMSTEDCE